MEKVFQLLSQIIQSHHSVITQEITTGLLTELVSMAKDELQKGETELETIVAKIQTKMKK